MGKTMESANRNSLYDPEKQVIYYKENIDNDSLEIVKARYKEARSDLDYVNEKINEIENNTYIEMP